MKGVFLDSATLGEEISLKPLENLGVQWTFYQETEAQKILERIAEAEIVIANKSVLTRQILQSAPHLKLICVAATGYNNIDMEAAQELNIAVCNVPGYSTESVIQLVMTFLLASAFSLVSYIEDVKAGKWQNQSQFCLLTHPIIELRGKKLGVIGYGTLGKQIAALARNFGMDILIATHTNSKKSQEETTSLKEVLCKSDFVTLHVPLTAQTKDLIRRQEIELMKPTAFLINTARGGVVNECLKEKRIAGACCDVLSEEPPKKDHPLLDPTIPNLSLTPHIGWASFEARVRLVKLLRANIEAFLQGKSQNLIT